MAADGLAMLGARASAAMVLTCILDYLGFSTRRVKDLAWEYQTSIYNFSHDCDSFIAWDFCMYYMYDYICDFGFTGTLRFVDTRRVGTNENILQFFWLEHLDCVDGTCTFMTKLLNILYMYISTSLCMIEQWNCEVPHHNSDWVLIGAKNPQHLLILT